MWAGKASCGLCCVLATMHWSVQVHEATRKLLFVPTSPEEFADLLAFLEKLESNRHSMDEASDHVNITLYLVPMSRVLIAMIV